MISGIFHQGSGLGDQLHRYITVRTLAKDRGFEWMMVGKDRFKGASFMNNLSLPDTRWEGFKTWNEKDIRDKEMTDIRSYDPEINFVEDGTLIDGSFEDDKYWKHRLHEINEWLEVEPIEVPDDVCVIGFRGGEYSVIDDLFLPESYWTEAIEKMRAINPNMRFEVHTDDPTLAKLFFRETPVIHDIGINWRSMRYAKHAIVANSAFYIMPRLLAHQEKDSLTIAPRYWARRNKRVWARPACFYRDFLYI